MISCKTYNVGYHSNGNLILSIFHIRTKARKSIVWKVLNGCNCDQNIPDEAVSWKLIIQSKKLKVNSYVHNTIIHENKQNTIALHNVRNIKVPISQ